MADRREAAEEISAAPATPKFPLSVAGAAFILSLSLAATNLWRHLLGPEIEVLAPKKALIHESGSTFAVSIPLTLINEAADYNDIVTGVKLSISGFADTSRYSLSNVRFHERPREESARYCDPQQKCNGLGLLAVTEYENEAPAVPGGGFYRRWFTFPDAFCGPKRCLSKMEVRERVKQGLSINLTMSLHSDGEREVTCSVRPFDSQFFDKNNWQARECVSS